MGEFASTVQEFLRDELATARPTLEWHTEYRIAGTPVDIAGVGAEELTLVELEWRRADPADNTAKLFRHLDAGASTTIRSRCFRCLRTTIHSLTVGPTRND
jgi:hypothetical protein